MIIGRDAYLFREGKGTQGCLSLSPSRGSCVWAEAIITFGFGIRVPYCSAIQVDMSILYSLPLLIP